VCDPFAWAQLRKMKMDDASNQSLVGAGTTDAIPMLLSLPVSVNPNCPPYSGVVIDKAAVVSAVGPVRVETSLERYFEKFSVGLMATWRIGQNIVRQDRCGTFTVAGDGS
jgi:HK97 family phage major capsid protein